MHHIMVDLETLSTRPNAAILSIGAVGLDDETEDREQFYCVIDDSSIDGEKFDICAETIQWWMNQSEEARAEFKKADKGIVEALEDFAQFVRQYDAPLIWGCGSDFDNVILTNAYELSGLEAPWEFWQNRCYRTIKRCFQQVVPPKREGVHHNALDDAEYQATHLVSIFKYLEDNFK